jgi:hypothetical protein
MKKILPLALVTVLALVLVVFFIQSSGEWNVVSGGNDRDLHQAGVSTPAPEGSGPAPATVAGIVPEPAEKTVTMEENQTAGGDTMSVKPDVRIKMTFNNEEVMVRMHDNPTTRDFLAMLPLTVTLEDYAGTEKITRLSKRLSTQDAPAGSDPSVGDFTYYSPWGNIAIFYRDFGYADGLIILGSIEPGGVEKLARMNGNFAVTMERTG